MVSLPSLGLADRLPSLSSLPSMSEFENFKMPSMLFNSSAQQVLPPGAPHTPTDNQVTSSAHTPKNSPHQQQALNQHSPQPHHQQALNQHSPGTPSPASPINHQSSPAQQHHLPAPTQQPAPPQHDDNTVAG